MEKKFYYLGGGLLALVLLQSFRRKPTAPTFDFLPSPTGEAPTGSGGLLSAVSGLFNPKTGVQAQTGSGAFGNNSTTYSGPGPVNYVSNVVGNHYASMSQQERANRWLDIIGTMGVESNNTSAAGADFVNKFDSSYRPINIEEQGTVFFPEIRSLGLDGRLAAISQKLQAKGYNITLKRINATGIGGIVKGIGKIGGLVLNPSSLLTNITR